MKITAVTNQKIPRNSRAGDFFVQLCTYIFSISVYRILHLFMIVKSLPLFISTYLIPFFNSDLILTSSKYPESKPCRIRHDTRIFIYLNQKTCPEFIQLIWYLIMCQYYTRDLPSPMLYLKRKGGFYRVWETYNTVWPWFKSGSLSFQGNYAEVPKPFPRTLCNRLYWKRKPPPDL